MFDLERLVDQETVRMFGAGQNLILLFDCSLLLYIYISFSQRILVTALLEVNSEQRPSLVMSGSMTFLAWIS